MKIQKENIVIPAGHSFKSFSPSLRNYFYWHYHPEVELVFIEGLTGIRHVGQHISGFMNSDLVLIGPNIPHLNFDYGLMSEYRQIVVQLKENFIKDILDTTPEFTKIKELFHRASLGIAFTGETKEQVARNLQQLADLDSFGRFILLIETFQLLASSNEYEVLNEEDTSVKLYLNDKLRMGTVYKYIHQNYHDEIEVNIIASKVNLSTAAFCRYFKRQTRLTFTEFVNQYRINQAKTMLLQDVTVSEACYRVGIQSLSYFNKLFKKLTGQGPLEFKKMFTQK